MNMSNKVYNILKYVALIVLPALATLLLGLGELWNIEIMPKIAVTVVAGDVIAGEDTLQAAVTVTAIQWVATT